MALSRLAVGVLVVSGVVWQLSLALWAAGRAAGFGFVFEEKAVVDESVGDNVAPAAPA